MIGLISALPSGRAVSFYQAKPSSRRSAALAAKARMTSVHPSRPS